MAASFSDLALYTSGIFLLFLTSGYLSQAIVGLSLSGGLVSAGPLALGVAVNDILCPALVII